MSTKDGQTYYTLEEVQAHIDTYIDTSAERLYKKLLKKKALLATPDISDTIAIGR